MNDRSSKPQAPTSRETQKPKLQAGGAAAKVTAAGGGSTIVRWFLSKTVRQATAVRKHVEKLLNHQRDILSPQAIEAVRGATRDLRNAVAAGADKTALEKQMETLENAAN